MARFVFIHGGAKQLKHIGWQLVAPKHAIPLRLHVDKTQKECIMRLCNYDDWKTFKKSGYKLEKVYVTVSK